MKWNWEHSMVDSGTKRFTSRPRPIPRRPASSVLQIPNASSKSALSEICATTQVVPACDLLPCCYYLYTYFSLILSCLTFLLALWFFISRLDLFGPLTLWSVFCFFFGFCVLWLVFTLFFLFPDVCFVRDSYLPQGSHGLKAVTKYKLGGFLACTNSRSVISTRRTRVHDSCSFVCIIYIALEKQGIVRHCASSVRRWSNEAQVGGGVVLGQCHQKC